MRKNHLEVVEKSGPVAKSNEIRYDDEALIGLYKIIRSQRDELRQMSHRLDIMMAVVSISVFMTMLGFAF